jgi:predicted amidohydrolase
MLLPGYALMALGTQIHVATWPFSWHLDPDLNSAPAISQVFAIQGGCYVIATSALLRPEDVREVYRELAISKIDEWIGAKKGGCRIIAPCGDVIAQAAVGEETILTASVSLETVLQAKANCDVSGHYSRPDVLQLLINRRPLERVVEMSSDYQTEFPIRGNDTSRDTAKRNDIEK